MSELRILKIDWEDAYTSEYGLIDLNSKDLVYEPITASCVGFLVRETPLAYLIASEFWEAEHSVKYVHCIPKHSIKKVTELGIVEQSKNLKKPVKEARKDEKV